MDFESETDPPTDQRQTGTTLLTFSDLKNKVMDAIPLLLEGGGVGDTTRWVGSVAKTSRSEYVNNAAAGHDAISKQAGPRMSWPTYVPPLLLRLDGLGAYSAQQTGQALQHQGTLPCCRVAVAQCV